MVMSNELYDLKVFLKCITNNCKPPQNFDFRETELSFRFIWFKKFPWVCYSCSREDGTYCLSSILFSHKNGISSVDYFSKISYQTWPTAVKTLKKHQNV